MFPREIITQKLVSIMIDYHLIKNITIAMLPHDPGYHGMQCSLWHQAKKGVLCLVSSKFSNRMLATDADQTMTEHSSDASAV